MESEYAALSMAMRTLLPIQNLFKSIMVGLGRAQSRKIIIKTTAHEDNQGALKLANLESGRTTTNSKFYALKYHWFRSWLSPNKIEMKYIKTNEQKADFMTKQLPTAPFEASRKLVCGW
jgi:hypothetical protein